MKLLIDPSLSWPLHSPLPGSYFLPLLHLGWPHSSTNETGWNLAGSCWETFCSPDKKTIFTGFPFCFLLVLKMLVWCFELQQPSWHHEATNLRTKILGAWNVRGEGKDNLGPWGSHWDRAPSKQRPLLTPWHARKINSCLFKPPLAGICVTCRLKHF